MKFRNYQLEIGLFLLALGIRLLYFWLVGTQISSDSFRYLAGAEEMQRVLNGDVSIGQITQPFYFLLYPMLIAALGLNQTAVIIVQLIMQSLVAVALYKLGTVIFNRTTGVLTGLVYCFYWEVFRWDTFILTDSLFIAFLVFSVLFYCLAEQSKKHGWWVWFGLFVLATAMTRPTALPFLLAVVSLLTWYWRRSWRWLLLAGLVIGGSSLLYLIWRYGVRDSRGINFYLDYYVGLYQEGVIIRGREAYDVLVSWEPGFTIGNIINVINIVVRRLVAFWVPFVPKFSLGHSLLSAVMLVPFYILLLRNLFKWRLHNIPRSIGFLLTMVLFFWLFQGLAEVDYDWRYRSPTLPFLIVLALGGIDTVFRTITQFMKRGHQ